MFYFRASALDGTSRTRIVRLAGGFN